MSKPWDHLLQPVEPVVRKILPGIWPTSSPHPINVTLVEAGGGSATLEFRRADGFSLLSFYPYELDELAEFCTALANQMRDK